MLTQISELRLRLIELDVNDRARQWEVRISPASIETRAHLSRRIDYLSTATRRWIRFLTLLISNLVSTLSIVLNVSFDKMWIYDEVCIVGMASLLLPFQFSRYFSKIVPKIFDFEQENRQNLYVLQFLMYRDRKKETIHNQKSCDEIAIRKRQLQVTLNYSW